MGKTRKNEPLVDSQTDFFYLGISESLGYFHIDTDPDKCANVIKAYCRQNEAFDIFQIGVKTMSCKRVISNGRVTKYGQELFHEIN